MSATTTAEPITATADIQARYDALTAQLEDRSAEHDEASAAFDAATGIEALSEARARRDTLAELARRLEAERDELEEPLRRAQEREHHARCKRDVAEAKARGAEKIAALHAAMCAFGRETIDPLMDSIAEAEESAYQAARGLNRLVTRGGQLMPCWHPYTSGGHNSLSGAAQAIREHVQRSERGR